MKFPEPRDENDANVLKHIKDDGVFIQGVFGDEKEPSFGYSLGLTHNFGHPEIFISGLTHEIRAFMINEICRRLRQGASHLVHGQQLTELLVGRDCVAAVVDSSQGRDYVYYAQWLHGTSDVPIMQIIWPSTSGLWPWDEKAPEDLINGQTILADISEFKAS